MLRPDLARGRKSWRHNSFGGFLGFKRRARRVAVMHAHDPKAALEFTSRGLPRCVHPLFDRTKSLRKRVSIETRPFRMRCVARTCGAAALVILLTAQGAALAEGRRVLLLHSFGPFFEPWSAVAGRFREELTRQLPAVDLYEASLEMARLPQPSEEAPLVDYMRALFAGRNLDLVVAVGAPAARFFQKYRAQFFPSTPLLITAADQRTFSEAALTSNDATVPSTLDLRKLVENILQVLPNTTNIAFVIGASPLERFWVQEMRQAFQPFAGRVTFEWFTDLPQEEMVKRAAILPPRSALFYASVRVDAVGIPNEQNRVLARLRQSANAPIFSYLDSNLGQGVVGGPVISTQELGRRAAEVAVRILNGERPADIKTTPVGLGTPVYDWRELQRWKISEARLPPGSIVQFREPSAWERYRWQLIAFLAALLVQSAMIGWLLIALKGRRKAELESRRRTLEVLHLNRTAEIGALSASFAHEVSQPLLAVELNAERAERLLGANPPEVGKAKEIVTDIRQANSLAMNVIRNLRNLLKRKSDIRDCDLNAVIVDAAQLLAPEANRRNIDLRVNGVQRALLVQADPVHLQQVVLNLVTNAMDAMADSPPGARTITVRIGLVRGSTVEVSVSDSGTGVPEHKLGEIFETFYTTKEQGTGLGLSVARTIIETYDGKIWAENRAGRGAVFRFALPLAR
jgi:signal transduction histidine kinase